MEDFLAPYRFNHGCGTISAQDGSGNMEGVAAGGQVVGFADTVEIYSVADGNWRYGIELISLVDIIMTLLVTKDINFSK